MPKILFTILFLFAWFAVYSQNQDFTADRPGLSNAPDLITKKTFQLETGFDISKYNEFNKVWQGFIEFYYKRNFF